ncbi:MAG: DUF4864 domain-containing protein [Alphaproteobacteria bacterium]|nr:DUF4864 domain-containing protein [Alphaproteobacteria bacterium]
MFRKLVLTVLLFLAPIAAQAETPDAADGLAFQRIIAAQIEAFRADDGPLAYSYAAPVIQRIFPSPETFMDMVKRGYRPLYRPQSFRFGESGPDDAGRPSQRVIVVGPDGMTYEALYSFERQPDGNWKINGCRLLLASGLDA